jgi:hypothetical protein
MAFGNFDCGLWNLALWNSILVGRVRIIYLLPMLRSSLTHNKIRNREGNWEAQESAEYKPTSLQCKHGSVCVGSRKCGWLPIMLGESWCHPISMCSMQHIRVEEKKKRRWMWHSHLHGPIFGLRNWIEICLNQFGVCEWWRLSFQAPRLELRCKSYKRAKTDFLSSLLHDLIGCLDCVDSSWRS